MLNAKLVKDYFDEKGFFKANKMDNCKFLFEKNIIWFMKLRQENAGL